MQKTSLALRCVIYREGDLWFAHSLELDIVAEAETPQEALSDLLSLCSVQIAFAVEQGEIKSLFRAAPPEYWAMFSRAKPWPSPPIGDGWPESVEVEQVDARELELCG